MRRTLALIMLAAVAALPPAGSAERQHWAFQPPAVIAVPAARDPQWKKWIRTPLDAFIAQRLGKVGLRPAAPADRRTLLRRVSLDLTGLPPSPEQQAAFLADSSPHAYEKLVDRLLASPHYGERWAQHWLDVVRFAESNGYELDEERPQAWRYRDYVVDALNRDLPYNRFLTEQIAGDELDPESFSLRTATGYLRAGPQHVVGGNQDEAENRQEWLIEVVDGLSASVLGLTVQCARCHDHKYDPIPQADYYRLQAFFAAAENAELRPPDAAAQSLFEAKAKEIRARQQPIRDALSAIETPVRARLQAERRARLSEAHTRALSVPASMRSPRERQLAESAQVLLKLSWEDIVEALPPADRRHRAELRRQLHALERELPLPLPAAYGVRDRPEAPPTHILFRGGVHDRRDEVQPGFPRVLTRGNEPVAAIVRKSSAGTGRRLALASWLTRPNHPLTARVIVNRVWQHHFGRGLVATPNDFGSNGARPSHPELLDWLAREFTRVAAGPRPGLGWSLKRLHRLVVLSSTYRQSSRRDPAAARIDPTNRTLWRYTPRRLDAESVRDAILAAAGTLNPESGGPSVRVPIEKEVYETIFTEAEPDNLWQVTPDEKQHTRRSLYLLRKRNVRLPMLAVFDSPDMITACGARQQSVHALQSLTLMNSDFALTQSRSLARRILTTLPAEKTSEAERIGLLFQLTLCRPPRPQEVRDAERFLLRQAAQFTGFPGGGESPHTRAWNDLCLALINANDFLILG